LNDAVATGGDQITVVGCGAGVVVLDLAIGVAASSAAVAVALFTQLDHAVVADG
jgi:hypothetical protein